MATQFLGYLGNNGVLTDGHGVPLGTYRIVATWRLPRTAWVSTRMCQVEAVINGVTYTGRSPGIGMHYKGKVKHSQKR